MTLLRKNGYPSNNRSGPSSQAESIFRWLEVLCDLDRASSGCRALIIRAGLERYKQHMTTMTSSHGARLQQDERLQPRARIRDTKVPEPAARPDARRVEKTLPERYRRSPASKRSKAKQLSRPSTKPSAPSVQTHRNQKAKPSLAVVLYDLFATPIAYLAGCAALLFGWLYRDYRDISAESGLGYLLGIIAVTCMITLLVYPVRKRFRFLKFLGSVKNWFRTHMLLGALGPIAALYHCNFQLGSLNSRVALYSALLVAGSGLIGRVLYQKMNQNLYGGKSDFNQLRKALQASTPALSGSLTFLPIVASRVGRFDKQIFDAGKQLRTSIKILPNLGKRARREKQVLLFFAEQQLARQARSCPVIRTHQVRLAAVLDRYLFLHMAQARKLARLQLYERLFALWHIVHLPFFFMLVASTAIHILAVHLY